MTYEEKLEAAALDACVVHDNEGNPVQVVSGRLKRHVEEGKGWRKELSHWLREELLADFDPKEDHGTPGRG